MSGPINLRGTQSTDRKWSWSQNTTSLAIYIHICMHAVVMTVTNTNTGKNSYHESQRVKCYVSTMEIGTNTI